MTTGLSLLKNVLKSLAEIVLIPLGLKASSTATDAATQNKIYESDTTTLVISNEEMEDIMKIKKKTWRIRITKSKELVKPLKMKRRIKRRISPNVFRSISN